MRTKSIYFCEKKEIFKNIAKLRRDQKSGCLGFHYDDIRIDDVSCEDVEYFKVFESERIPWSCLSPFISSSKKVVIGFALDFAIEQSSFGVCVETQNYHEPRISENEKNEIFFHSIEKVLTLNEVIQKAKECHQMLKKQAEIKKHLMEKADCRWRKSEEDQRFIDWLYS